MKISRVFKFLVSCFACLVAVVSSGSEIVPGMALIPAGRYTPLFRGARETNYVEVAAFLLDTVPVTNARYLEFVRANPKWRRSTVVRLFADEDYLKDWAADLEIGSTVAPDAPVTCVPWFAAKAFAAWAGRRLPFTAEWEYAAAASATRADGLNDPAFVAQIERWYTTPSAPTLASVAQSPPNIYGVYDLHGLVWEWVADFSTAMVTGDSRGDAGLDRSLFCAGGSENATDRNNFPAFMRYGLRSSLKANYTLHNLGFRCAKTIELTTPKCIP
ncbi:MAG TPA: formylglycine-generating enzyme family protein [Verrucomicrobiae bacterium]|jgi:formylglycine-generating enzyme required for sulfatase activity|nr:formylglycine-generating enzyme family protein [Verrucomicrobiae bacterium]